MVVFTYRAHRLDGAEVAGEIAADTAREALAAGRERGLFGSALRPRRQGPLLCLRQGISRPAILGRRFLVRRRGEEALLCRQLAVLLRSGLPLYESLQSLAGSRSDGYAVLLRELAAGLAAGRTFSELLAARPQVFSQLSAALVRVGERSGRLPEMMQQLAAWLEQSCRSREKLKTALLYPSVLLIETVGLGIFLTLVVLPALSSLILSLRADVPWPTRLLLSWSAFVQASWPLLLTGVIAAAVLLLLLLRLPRVADRAERLRLSLPFFGELRREVLWLQVLRALSMLVSCGISIDEAAREAASVTGSRYMRQRLLAVAAGIRQGFPLTELLTDERTLPPLLLEFLRAGETSGCLQEMLDHGADYAEMMAEHHAARLQALAEPLAYLIVFALVGGFVAAVSLPLLDMMLLV